MQKFLLILIPTMLVNATYCSQSSSQRRDPATEYALLERYREAQEEERRLKKVMILAWLRRTSREQDTTLDPVQTLRPVNVVILP